VSDCSVFPGTHDSRSLAQSQSFATITIANYDSTANLAQHRGCSVLDLVFVHDGRLAFQFHNALPDAAILEQLYAASRRTHSIPQLSLIPPPVRWDQA
jgi:hypothetical protein